ncbi:hypothetical protein JTB14_009902 [Gonioctena quinquepunctata]|nr:hypothetical protein JTB14_009902 [Gonioctena quinquepunctata]
MGEDGFDNTVSAIGTRSIYDDSIVNSESYSVDQLEQASFLGYRTAEKVENDTENLVKYRLVGGTLQLKANICPHKFDCQKAVEPKKEQGAYEKRRRIELVENLLTKQVPSTSSQSSSFQSFELIECDKMELNETEDPETDDPLPEDITFTESVTHNHANKKRNKRVPS